MSRFLRGSAAFILFAIFGIGAALISPLMAVLGTPDRCQPTIRLLWRIMVFLFRATGLISIDTSGVGCIKGSVIAASHPSLIDVVIAVAIIPRTLFVAKSSLARNPALRLVIRHAALPDDAQLVEVAPRYLAAGWNILVFPEGTRTRVHGSLNPLRRGTAQLAIRAGAPLVCLKIKTSAQLLAKGQNPFDMTPKTVAYSLSSQPLEFMSGSGVSVRRRAELMTAEIAKVLSES